MRIDLPDMSSPDAITRQLSQGYYSTFRTYNDRKKVLGLQAHLQRLYQPTAAQGISPAMEVDQFRQFLAEVLQGFRDEVRVRVIMTMEGYIYVVIEALIPPPPDVYLQGVKLVTTDMRRKNPRLKSTDFISASLGERTEISRSNIFEALLVSKESILEGMTSNFFYIKDGKLGTAKNNILLGVTRRTVLRVARMIGLDILYQPLELRQIRALSEAFITSSSRGIVPVVQINDRIVGQGSPGKVTNRLSASYNEYVKRHAEFVSLNRSQGARNIV